jgi:fructose-1,6-bisphosphatase
MINAHEDIKKYIEKCENESEFLTGWEYKFIESFVFQIKKILLSG